MKGVQEDNSFRIRNREPSFSGQESGGEKDNDSIYDVD